MDSRCGRRVHELNARILLGCPSISAPAYLHLDHLPFPPRRPLPYPLTWLGEMKHMAICRRATRPVRHCRSRPLESCFDHVANSGRRKCYSVQYPASARCGENDALPLAISSPSVSTAQYLWAPQLSLSGHKGLTPPTWGWPPVCLFAQAPMEADSRQQTSFSCTCTDSGKPAMTPPGLR